VYKYANFAASVVGAGSISGVPALPIGLSFYTFQALAFLAAAYSGRIPTRSPVEALAFLAFFPQLIAGPIVLPRELLPQLRRLRTQSAAVVNNVAVGSTLFVLGFAKISLIAEPAGAVADYAFGLVANGSKADVITVWFGVLAYAVQIYFDFSAYSDMAIGLARILGVRLPVNFWPPYKSLSLIDFWRRWHITLGRFLSFALYRPLGGNRHGIARQSFAILATMLLGGLWHGAGYTFLVWGAMHGLGLVLAHGVQQMGLRLPAPATWFATLSFVVLAWVPFRAPDLQTTLSMWSALAFQAPFALPTRLQSYVPSGLQEFVQFDGTFAYELLAAGGVHGILAVVFGLALSLLVPNIYSLLRDSNPALYTKTYISRFGSRAHHIRFSLTGYVGCSVCLLFLISLFWGGRPQAFLYFQF